MVSFCCFIWLLGWLGLLLCFFSFHFTLLRFLPLFSRKILLYVAQFPFFFFFFSFFTLSPFMSVYVVLWLEHKHVSYFNSSSVV